MPRSTLSFNLIIASILIFCSGCNAINRLYINFDEAKRKHASLNDGVTRLYFDRNGYLYPESAIDAAKLKKAYTVLGYYYYNDTTEYRRIAEENKADYYSGAWASFDADSDPLQRKLIDKYVDQINKLGHGCDIVFLIHGYNDHPTLPPNGSSFQEFFETRQLMSKMLPERKFHFVEVYWDGLASRNGSKNLISRGLNSNNIWNNAQVSATYAGLELRRILSRLASKNVRVITHSHGAAVITTALFNNIRFKPHLYDDPGHYLHYDIKARFNHQLYTTPLQEYFVGMLAPAIPGENVFSEYRNRTILGKDSIVNLKNYHFIVGFNEFDRTTKKFINRPAMFGSTTLACSRKELAKTKNVVGNNEMVLDDVDFSWQTSGKKQRSHSWLVYMRNSTAFKAMLDKMFR